MSTSTASRLLEPWAVPWPVLCTAILVPVGLVVPVVVAYVACLAVAIKARARFAMLRAVPVALAAAVAVGLSGQPFVAACFAGLACLLIAPANILDNGLMAGLPTIVVVYLAQPAGGDPVVAALGLLAGAVVAIVVLARIPKTGRRSPIAPEIAYLHAGTMAGAAGGAGARDRAQRRRTEAPRPPRARRAGRSLPDAHRANA